MYDDRIIFYEEFQLYVSNIVVVVKLQISDGRMQNTEYNLNTRIYLSRSIKSMIYSLKLSLKLFFFSFQPS